MVPDTFHQNETNLIISTELRVGRGRMIKIKQLECLYYKKLYSECKMYSIQQLKKHSIERIFDTGM